MKKIIGLLLFLATTVFTFATDDHGNSIATATRINPNSITPGRIEVGNDSDIFRIKITHQGILNVYTTGSTPLFGYFIHGGTTTGSYDPDSYNNNFRFLRSVTPGIYYIQVRHLRYTGTGPYTLVSEFTPGQAQDFYGHGDGMASATPINPNSTTSGRIATPGSINYYKITIPSAGTLVVNTTGSIDTYGLLLSASGSQIASDSGSGSMGNFRISRSVTAGTYYVRVRHYYPLKTGSYSLVSQFTPSRIDQIQDSINRESRISTHAFGGGCITSVGSYAKRRTCSASNDNQSLTYASSRVLKNPLTNKCLTAQSSNNGSKITYTSCQANSTAQIFSYNSARKQFIHTASRKCLDVHGGNRRDLILWRCHGGINQKFYIQQSNTGNFTLPDSALRGSVSRGSSNMGLVGSNRARHIGR
ncbi:MAG: RICIN domain-containing protein [Sulfurovum sp.]|nr:RICIN domain-containing protein [Sulfurovum sp.]MCB4781372.1 RICIN domain-containing protein [Sulfurovum sp.]